MPHTFYKLLSLPFLFALLSYCGPQENSEFSGLIGPDLPSPIPVIPTRTSTEHYSIGNTNGIAIMLTNTDSSWLGLVHGLKSIGVPFRIVANIDEALTHKVILVYPSLTGANTEPEALQALAGHVRDGGTLIGFSVIGGGMPNVFGFEDSLEIPRQSEMTFMPDPLLDPLFNGQDSRTMRLAPVGNPDNGLPGVIYQNPTNPPLIVFGDQSAMMTYNVLGEAEQQGHAYALGLDLGHYILRAQNGRFTGLTDNYVNTYQPYIDTLLRLMSAIYEQGETDAVLIRPAPFNKDFTALITHDVDFTQSVINSDVYSAVELERGVPATYFVQTKYTKDYSDDVFYNLSNAALLQQIADRGMEIASHTVSHSNLFKSMPMGTGTESYPSYTPFVEDYETVRDASILGELRVSKFLLETHTGQEIVSFRPGHLSLPEALPELLQASDYQFSSSITANEALTHLPYQMMFGRTYNTELPLYEFPVTIEDEAGTLGDRLDDAIAISHKIAQYGGLVNIMIHPDILDHKLRFLQGYIDEFEHSAWFSTVGDFGRWWQVRDTATIQTLAPNERERVLAIQVRGKIAGLTLTLPSTWQYTQGLTGTVQEGDRIILGEFTDSAQLRFTRAR